MASGMTFEQMQKKYLVIFINLIILTGLTVAVSYIHFSGFWHVAVGVAIAVLKAVLVMQIFMHLKFDNPKLRYFVIVPVFFFLAIVFGTAVLGL
jgi:cytochrome c oxidase subunit IV